MTKVFDFNKYDDVIEVKGYDGFIDRDGNFYKVCKKRKRMKEDSHNRWAEEFLKEKLNISEFNFNQTVSALFTLVSLRGPAEILVNCFGYVYYSHEPIYYEPIIKIPNPKIANYKVTEEQLNMLYSLMIYNNENTDIPIFYNDCDIYEYSELDDGGKQKRI